MPFRGEVCIPKAMPLGYICLVFVGRFIEIPVGYSCFSLTRHNKNNAAISVNPFHRTLFSANSPQPAPKALSRCPWLALPSTLRPPFYLSSPSVMGERWENDGRTMGELRTKERWKRVRVSICVFSRNRLTDYCLLNRFSCQVLVC